MGALLNRARMTTATTGTGTITLGSASTGFATFAEAGATNATAYSYCIEDGNDFEIGVGTYTSSGTTFSRDTVTLSKIGGTAGTSKINLSGSATIFITARAQEIATLDLAQTYTATRTITPAANTNALAVTGYSLTGSNAQSLIDLAGTWNTSGTPTALKLNITNTDSNAASLLQDWQVGGVSQIAIRRNGTIMTPVGGPSQPIITNTVDTTSRLYWSGIYAFAMDFGGACSFATGLAGISTSNTGYYSWSSNSVAHNPSDLFLYRDAANTLAQRNGTTAQTANLYRSHTDSSNYSRLTKKWNTSTAVIHAEGAGTGSDGSVAFNDAALATNATVGFLMIPSCAGAPSGTPADIPTGQCPIVFDSTNNKLYVYDGGWLSTAALT